MQGACDPVYASPSGYTTGDRPSSILPLRKLVLVLALLWSTASGASDQALWEKSTLNQIIQRGELRVGLETGYMPFEMLDKNGNIIGFDVDLAKKMASVLKVKVRFVNTQWDGIIPALLTDKFDLLMGGMTITPERNMQVNFAKPYIVIGQTALLAKRHQGKIAHVAELNDPRYVVATKLGTSGDTAARRVLPKAQIRSFDSEADGAQEVKNGRVDAFVYDLPFNVIFAQDYPDSVALLGEPFTTENLGWALRKGDPDFLNWLDNFIDAIHDDGTYDRLHKQWFEGNSWKKNLNAE
jgi:polar amino acid transport system substrate-binding protein